MIVCRETIYKEPQITQQDRAINTTQSTNICQQITQIPLLVFIFGYLFFFTKGKIILALDLVQFLTLMTTK